MMQTRRMIVTRVFGLGLAAVVPLGWLAAKSGVANEVLAGGLPRGSAVAGAGAYQVGGAGLATPAPSAGRGGAGMTAARIDASPAASPAASPVAANGGDGDVIVVETFDIYFTPAAITIPADTEVTIRVVNRGAALHAFVIDELGIDSGDLGREASAEIVVNAPAGSYAFYCTVPGHRAGGMEGVLAAEA